MPDLPLDTLIILGLVFASIVGRFFKKKDGASDAEVDEPAKKSQKNEEGLQELLKKAWKEATGVPSDSQPVERPPFIPTEKTISNQIEQRLDSDHTQGLKKSRENVPKIIHQKPPQGKRKAHNVSFQWVKQDLKTSRSSLKKAIVTKEILEKPVSLRNFSE